MDPQYPFWQSWRCLLLFKNHSSPLYCVWVSRLHTPNQRIFNYMNSSTKYLATQNYSNFLRSHLGFSTRYCRSVMFIFFATLDLTPGYQTDLHALVAGYMFIVIAMTKQHALRMLHGCSLREEMLLFSLFLSANSCDSRFLKCSISFIRRNFASTASLMNGS